MDPMLRDKLMGPAAGPEEASEDSDTKDLELKASLMDEIMNLIDQSAVKRLPKKPGEEEAPAPSMPPLGA